MRLHIFNYTHSLSILLNIHYHVLSKMKTSVYDVFCLFSKQFRTEDLLWRDK